MPYAHRSRMSFARSFVLSIALWALNGVFAHATLIHEWNFDETSGTNLADSVGSADAIIMELPGGGGYTLGGGAVELAGGTRSSADYIELPDGIFDGLTDVTIEIWAEPHTFLNFSRVIDIGRGDADPNPTSDNFRLSFCDATDGNHQFMGLRPGRVDTTLTTPVNRNYHHVLVWTATGGPGGQPEIRWYRDGVLATNQLTAAAPISVLADLPVTVTWLGRSSYSVDETANASFHAVRIYDTALTEEEIILNTLKGPDQDGPDGVDGLIHRWSFSETSGTALTDSVGGATGDIVVPGGGGGSHSLGGGALRLFGGAKATSDYAELPAGLLDGLTDVTIEAWATPYSAQNWSRLFDFGTGVSTENTWFLSFTIGTDLNQQRFEYGANPAAWTLNTALATTPGDEYHYVVIWSAAGGSGGGGRAAWYRDGVLAGEIDTGAFTVADVADTVLWLGRSQWPDNTADAAFNEFRIYNRALTPAEISFNGLNGPDNVTIPAPVAVDDFMTLNPGAMASIPVLANDGGAKGDPNTLVVASPPSFGTAEVRPGGHVLYTHDGGLSTADQFTYTVQNSVGATSAPATVFVTVDPALRLPNTTITVPDEPPPVAYGVVDAFPGLFFEDALAITTPPGRTNQLFVVERRGIVSYIPDIHAASPVRQVFLDIRDQVSFDDTPQGERGLLGLAFHPGFETNGYFFVTYIAPGGSPYFDRLARFIANPTTLTVATNTQTVLYDVVDQVFNHNGGDLHFGPDGYLYIGTGDEGDQYNQRQNAQRIDKDLFSALLRIDVDRKPGSVEPSPSANTTTVYTNGSGQAYYAIPPDNPFVGATMFNGQPINTNALRAEIFALGFRHIWRFSIDMPTGDIWVGDVGQDRWEEINVVTNGGNYGWAYYEGFEQANTIYGGQPNLPNPPPGFVHSTPIYAYIHAGQGGDPNFSGDSVTGGVVYRGNNLPELSGAYVFADFEFQNIWALRRNGTNVTVERLTARLGIAGFGVAPSNGDVLLANYFEDSIQRLVRTDAGGTPFPQKLSETGIFADLDTLAPNPGIVAYEPKVAFWSDNAIKSRWFTIPDLTNTVGFAQDGNWTLPTGMKWIKHFDLELERGNPATRKRVETRVLVKKAGGSYGISYRWNDAETEAFLVPDGGETFTLTITNQGIPTNQFYEIPSRAGCLACHTAGGGHALTFNTREMNSEGSLNGYTGNQIDTLDDAGYFSAPVPPATTLPTHARADDMSASTEFRSRSYLAVNCAQCHQTGGTGGGAWDARAHLTLDQTGLINGLLDNNGGDPANRLIVPGDKDHSVVWLRIQATNGFSRMPPLGSHVLDQTAIALIEQWISSDLTNRTYEQFQIAHFGSTNNLSGAPDQNPDLDRGDNYYEFLTRTDPNVFGDEWLLEVTALSNLVTVSFEQVPNLGVLIETADGVSQPWDLWNVTSNSLWFPASTGLRSLTGPQSDAGAGQLFRARFVEP